MVIFKTTSPSSLKKVLTFLMANESTPLPVGQQFPGSNAKTAKAHFEVRLLRESFGSFDYFSSLASRVILVLKSLETGHPDLAPSAAVRNCSSVAPGIFAVMAR